MKKERVQNKQGRPMRGFAVLFIFVVLLALNTISYPTSVWLGVLNSIITVAFVPFAIWFVKYGRTLKQ